MRKKRFQCFVLFVAILIVFVSNGFSITIQYKYDTLNRLISAERNDSYYLFEYTYDNTGNRLTCNISIDSTVIANVYDVDNDGDVDGEDIYNYLTNSDCETDWPFLPEGLFKELGRVDND